MENIPEISVKKQTGKIKSGLYLKVPSLDSDEFKKTKEILSHFSGENPVIIVCADDNRRLAAPKSLYIKEDSTLIGELSALLGEENVKFVK